MTPFSIGQSVVTDDGDEGRIIEIYRSQNLDGDMVDYVAIDCGRGCVLDVPAEIVRAS